MKSKTAKNSQKGFSLLEVLVAVLLFSIVVLAASGAQNQFLRSNHQGEIKSEAAQAAQSVVDELRQSEVEAMPASGSDEPREIIMNGNRDYSVQVTYCEDGAQCTSNSVRQIVLTVMHAGQEVYKTETIFTDLGAAPNSSPTSSGTSSATPVPTASATPAPTATPTPIPTPTPTPTPIPTPSSTPKPKPTKCKWWNC